MLRHGACGFNSRILSFSGVPCIGMYYQLRGSPWALFLSFDSDMDKLVESLSVLERHKVLLDCLVEIPIYYYYF